ncbi:hypothetical protein IWZ00DRAFT_528228 [Phyllosticta capitalensis]
METQGDDIGRHRSLERHAQPEPDPDQNATDGLSPDLTELGLRSGEQDPEDLDNLQSSTESFENLEVSEDESEWEDIASESENNTDFLGTPLPATSPLDGSYSLPEQACAGSTDEPTYPEESSGACSFESGKAKVVKIVASGKAKLVEVPCRPWPPSHHEMEESGTESNGSEQLTRSATEDEDDDDDDDDEEDEYDYEDDDDWKPFPPPFPEVLHLPRMKSMAEEAEEAAAAEWEERRKRATDFSGRCRGKRQALRVVTVPKGTPMPHGTWYTKI